MQEWTHTHTDTPFAGAGSDGQKSTRRRIKKIVPRSVLISEAIRFDQAVNSKLELVVPIKPNELKITCYMNMTFNVIILFSDWKFPCSFMSWVSWPLSTEASLNPLGIISITQHKGCIPRQKLSLFLYSCRNHIYFSQRHSRMTEGGVLVKPTPTEGLWLLNPSFEKKKKNNNLFLS